jgi:hypothetical protein
VQHLAKGARARLGLPVAKNDSSFASIFEEAFPKLIVLSLQ